MPNGSSEQGTAPTFPKSFPVIACVADVGWTSYPLRSWVPDEQRFAAEGRGWVCAHVPDGGDSQTR